jgi:hypothetical protein
MNLEMEKAIMAIAGYATEIDKLNSLLSNFIDSYKDMRKLLGSIQETESDIQSEIDTINRTVMQNVELLRTWEEKTVGDTSRELIDLSGRLERFVTKSQEEINASGKTINQVMQSFEPQLDTISTYHQTLDNIQNELNRFPELLQISSNLQHSLGVISGVEELQAISEKLDTQLAELQHERDEILKPLKNAATFSEVVKRENEEMYEKISGEFITQVGPLKEEMIQSNNMFAELLDTVRETASQGANSINDKLDLIIIKLDEINSKVVIDVDTSKSNIRKSLFKRTPKESPEHVLDNSDIEESSDNALQTIEEIYNQRQDHSYPLVVQRENWTINYVFVVKELSKGKALGYHYKRGIRHPDQIDSRPLDEKKYRLYTGTFLEQILENEKNNDDAPF